MLFSCLSFIFLQISAVPCQTQLAYADSVRLAGQVEVSRDLYADVAASCPEIAGVYWRIGRSFLELADDEYNKTGSGLSHDQKMLLYRQALSMSFKAARMDPKDDRALEMISTSYAAIINISSLKMKAQLADSVRIYAEESVKINPRNDTSWHILGRWQYEVARLNWLLKLFSQFFFGGAPDGSYHKAEEYFRIAAETLNAPVNRYWLGLALEAQGKTMAAKLEYEKILNRKGGVIHHNDGIFEQKARERLNQ